MANLVSIANVHGGSMYPLLNSGDKVFLYDEVPIVGDIITFRDRDNYLTHRIIKVKPVIVTKGDNVPFYDERPVSPDQIIGVVQKILKTNNRLIELKTLNLNKRMLKYGLFEMYVANLLNAISGKTLNNKVKAALQPLYYGLVVRSIKNINNGYHIE